MPENGTEEKSPGTPPTCFIFRFHTKWAAGGYDQDKGIWMRSTRATTLEEACEWLIKQLMWHEDGNLFFDNFDILVNGEWRALKLEVKEEWSNKKSYSRDHLSSYPLLPTTAKLSLR